MIKFNNHLEHMFLSVPVVIQITVVTNTNEVADYLTRDLELTPVET